MERVELSGEECDLKRTAEDREGGKNPKCSASVKGISRTFAFREDFQRESIPVLKTDNRTELKERLSL
jgi:hypothetical protein